MAGKLSHEKPLAQCCRTNLLTLLILVGVFVGVVVGVGLQVNGVELDQQQTAFLKFPGEIFLQMMKMVMIPVVVSSLVTATADIDVRASGKIGLRTLVYYLSTLVLASVLGIALCLTVKPGKRTELAVVSDGRKTDGASPVFAFMDLIRNLFPDNLVEACFSSKATAFRDTDMVEGDTEKYNTSRNDSNSSHAATESPSLMYVKQVRGANMVGLVAVSVMTGAIISSTGDSTKPVYHVFKAIRIIAFRLVGVFLWYSPVGIAFLVLSTFAGISDLTSSLHDLAIFTVTVIGGLFIHVFVVLSLIYFIFARKNPYKFLRSLVPAMLVAFGSESSGVTIPVTIRCLEEKNDLDPRVTRLVASLGATINMDGVSLYFSMMAIFLAQLSGISLSAGQIVAASLMAISVAIGMGCVAGSQYAYMVMMPAALGLPADNVSMLFAVDWLLARCRTVTNVVGDGFGAGVVHALSSRDLRQPPSEENSSKGASSDNTKLTGDLDVIDSTPLADGQH